MQGAGQSAVKQFLFNRAMASKGREVDQYVFLCGTPRIELSAHELICQDNYFHPDMSGHQFKPCTYCFNGAGVVIQLMCVFIEVLYVETLSGTGSCSRRFKMVLVVVSALL